MSEVKSVEQTKQVLELALTAVDVVVSAKKDGKVDMQDIGLLLTLVPKIGPAVDGIQEIPAELSDLSAEEAAELTAFVMGRLAIEDAKARDVLEKGLKAAAAAYALIKAINAPASA